MTSTAFPAVSNHMFPLSIWDLSRGALNAPASTNVHYIVKYVFSKKMRTFSTALFPFWALVTITLQSPLAAISEFFHMHFEAASTFLDDCDSSTPFSVPTPILVNSGFWNRTPKMGWRKQQQFTPHSSEVQEVWIKVLAGPGVGAHSWWTDSHLPPVSMPGRQQREKEQVLSYICMRAQILFFISSILMT